MGQPVNDKVWVVLTFTMLLALVSFGWYAVITGKGMEATGAALIVGFLISKLGTMIDYRYGASRLHKDNQGGSAAAAQVDVTVNEGGPNAASHSDPQNP